MQAANFALDFVQQLDLAQGLLGELTFVRGVQFEELEPVLDHRRGLRISANTASRRASTKSWSRGVEKETRQVAH